MLCVKYNAISIYMCIAGLIFHENCHFHGILKPLCLTSNIVLDNQYKYNMCVHELHNTRLVDSVLRAQHIIVMPRFYWPLNPVTRMKPTFDPTQNKD